MGLLRILLALTVLNYHYPFIVPVNFIFSFSAVFIFMMISGFYISMVLDERYGKSLLGVLSFYGNRILRLFPPYLAVLAVCYLLLPAQSISIADVLLIPRPLLWQFGLTDEGLYLGQMFTVALELMFYAIAPFIVLQRLRWLVLAFAAAVVYTATTWWLGVEPRAWQYEFFPGTLLYFFAGSLAYRLYLCVARWRIAPWIGYAALPLIVLCGCLTPSARAHIWTNEASVFAFYALCAALLPFLFIASKSCRWDRLIGDLSYPLYIVHAPVIDLVTDTPRLGGEHDGGIAVLGLSLAFTVVLYVLVDRPVDKWRHWATKRLNFNLGKERGPRLAVGLMSREEARGIAVNTTESPSTAAFS